MTNISYSIESAELLVNSANRVLQDCIDKRVCDYINKMNSELSTYRSRLRNGGICYRKGDETDQMLERVKWFESIKDNREVLLTTVIQKVTTEFDKEIVGLQYLIYLAKKAGMKEIQISSKNAYYINYYINCKDYQEYVDNFNSMMQII